MTPHPTDAEIAEIEQRLEEAASSEAMDVYGRDEVSRRLVREAAALIAARAARIEALEKALATERVTQVRGSNDTPGFEACVNAEIESIRATLERSRSDA